MKKILYILFPISLLFINCSREIFPPINLYWNAEVKKGISDCKSMCEISNGLYEIYNYPTNSCYCKRTNGPFWKTYKIYKNKELYIEHSVEYKLDIKSDDK